MISTPPPEFGTTNIPLLLATIAAVASDDSIGLDKGAFHVRITSLAFAPANAIDRHLRPNLWKTVKWPRHSGVVAENE